MPKRHLVAAAELPTLRACERGFLLCAALLGCSGRVGGAEGQGSGGVDAGQTELDAGASSFDAGTVPADAGAAPFDAEPVIIFADDGPLPAWVSSTVGYATNDRCNERTLVQWANGIGPPLSSWANGSQGAGSLVAVNELGVLIWYSQRTPDTYYVHSRRRCGIRRFRGARRQSH